VGVGIADEPLNAVAIPKILIFQRFEGTDMLLLVIESFFWPIVRFFLCVNMKMLFEMFILL
jgi:hypothetical protein